MGETGKTLADARIALFNRAFINDSDDARNTPTGPFFEMTLSRGAQITVHDSQRATSPGVPPGLSQDLEQVLASARAVVVFAGHKKCRGPVPERVEALCRCAYPTIMDGWSDKNRHALQE